MPAMLHESIILPPSDETGPLYITAKRYWMPTESNVPTTSSYSHITPPLAGHAGKDTTTNHAAATRDHHTGLTLVFLHSTSFHKETWEPALEDLFRRVSMGQSSSSGLPPIVGECDDIDKRVNSGNGKVAVVIREAWAIDCPNHGESAELNHRLLEPASESSGIASLSCENYAVAVHRFMSARPKLADGQRVDFRSRKLVGIGHSLGANSMLMLQRMQPRINFSSLIIVEPLVSPDGRQHLAPLREKLVAAASKRLDRWSTREEAMTHFRSLRGPGGWDPRVLESFINHAIHWCPESRSFILSCSTKQEIIMYIDEEGPEKPVEDLNAISHLIPIHLILGEQKDFIPAHVHRTLTDPNSGRHFASIHTMSGVGHLIPQTIPSRVAERIYEILLSESALNVSRL